MARYEIKSQPSFDGPHGYEAVVDTETDRELCDAHSNETPEDASVYRAFKPLLDELNERAADLAALRTRAEKAERDALLAARGIETPCPTCGGCGARVYGSTATWRGGIGGQAMTSDVCDACWGSGDAESPWADLRAMRARLDAATRLAHRLQHGGAIEGDDVCEWQERAVVAESENDSLRAENEEWRRRAEWAEASRDEAVAERVRLAGLLKLETARAERAEHARDSIDRIAEAAESMRDAADARAEKAERERDEVREKYERWLVEECVPLRAVAEAAEELLAAHDTVDAPAVYRARRALRDRLRALDGGADD